MKYIVLKVELENEMLMPLPIIFPNSLVHSMVADQLVELCKKCWPGKKITVVTAGDASIKDIALGGRSESLGLNSFPALDKGMILYGDSIPVLAPGIKYPNQ